MSRGVRCHVSQKGIRWPRSVIGRVQKFSQVIVTSRECALRAMSQHFACDVTSRARATSQEPRAGIACVRKSSTFARINIS